jgi:Zc3h12a-like Ribonuclease NYN domain
MPRHVVVDGSNLATEGRSMPSLQQLNEAVLAYLEDNPADVVTVVVDATFGHRISPSEVPEFDEAVANNEIVSPPAGAIGRGDAFVLTIANKANAVILSNDSFQEFHPDYPWLFDDGRLVGGKPVPHVGWVFVARSPVRGIVSRRATKAKQTGKSLSRGRGAAKPSDLALQPMPVPKTPPPGRARKVDPVETSAPAAVVARAAKSAAPATAAKPAKARQAAAPKVAVAPMSGSAINEALPFLAFVEANPVGSLVDATVESYSSHGAYATCGDARVYIPMRAMKDPAPRSAREVLSLGQTVTLVITSFNPSRRGIDAGLPEVVGMPEGAPAPAKAAKKGRVAKAVPKPAIDKSEPVPAAPVGKSTKKAPAKKSSTKIATPKQLKQVSDTLGKAPVAKAVPVANKVAASKASPSAKPAKQPAAGSTVALPAAKKVAKVSKTPAAKQAAPTTTDAVAPSQPRKKAAKISADGGKTAKTRTVSAAASGVPKGAPASAVVAKAAPPSAKATKSAKPGKPAKVSKPAKAAKAAKAK